jgi:hemolysin III
MTALDGVAGESSPRLATEAPAAAGRHISQAKPLLRGWLHLAWFEASLVLGTLMVVHARGGVRIAAVAIFAVSVSGMFGVSALYHRGNWTAAWRQRLQRLDHAMILLLIAGTATPAFLLTTHGALRVTSLAVMWVLTLTALGIRMVWMQAPELLVGSTYVGLGWVAGLSLPAVWLHSGVTAGALMLVGGLLYTAGALSYHRRWPDPSPAVFGYHEVFHVFVCAAATCHFVAIALFIA